MPETIKIKIKPGSEVSQLVDAFCLKNGSQGKARDTDLFFLAYQNENLVGCVRFCWEENTAMLRTMMVDESVRQQRIGSALLAAFENYLVENKIKNTYCIPYSHLDKFYGKIGFQIIPEEKVPPFLIERLQTYRAKGKTFFCMRRP